MIIDHKRMRMFDFSVMMRMPVRFFTLPTIVRMVMMFAMRMFMLVVNLTVSMLQRRTTTGRP